METHIKVSDYGEIIITSMPDIFRDGVRYFCLKYTENGADLFSIKFNIENLSSLLINLFVIQSYIQSDEYFYKDILLHPNYINKLSITRTKGSENVSIFSNSQGFKIDNGYVGRVLDCVENILVRSNNYNDNYFL